MPDVSELFRSQPGWVVVAVILILAAAYVLRPVLAGRYGRGEDDDEDDEAAPAHGAQPIGGPGRTYDSILGALDRLHEVATREGVSREQAERERDDYRVRLEQAYRDLAECERAAGTPIRDAHRYADRRNVGTAHPPGRRHRLEPDRWSPRDAG